MLLAALGLAMLAAGIGFAMSSSEGSVVASSASAASWSGAPRSGGHEPASPRSAHAEARPWARIADVVALAPPERRVTGVDVAQVPLSSTPDTHPKPVPAGAPTAEPNEAPLVIPPSVMIPEASPEPGPSPEAAATPSPAPTRHSSFLGRGPLRFSALGGFDVGSHHASTTTSLTASDVLGISFMLGLERRTEQTSLSIQDPVGYASGSSSVGQIQAIYRAAKYAVAYGALTDPSNSQIGIGGFARGLELRLPRRNGELDVLGAAATQASGEGFRSMGLRRQYYLPRNALLTGTLILSRGEQSGAKNLIADATFQRFTSNLSSNLEAAIDRTSNVIGGDNGARIAAAAQFNAPLKAGYASFSVRSIPQGFMTLTTTDNADKAWGLTFQRTIGRSGSLLVDLGRDDAFAGNEWNRTIRRNLTYSQPVGSSSSVTVLESYSRSTAGGQSTVNRSDGFTASETIKGFSLSQTLQRATANGSGGTALQTQESLSIGHALANGFIQAQSVLGRQSSGGIASDQRQLLFSYTRRLSQRTDLTLNNQFTVSDSAGQATMQRSTSIGLIRRLSSVVALNIAATRSFQSGLNANGASSINVDLVGPLAFGGTRVSGRANPNLPATIMGHVYVVSSNAGAAYGQRGVGNVLLLLDGTTPVRTDIDGGYEFRFVKQGYHTISIVQGTVSSGLVADRGQVSLDVAGGQTATVDFAVGAFAGVTGHLYAATSKGPQPIAGVEIVVDGGRHATTGPDGAYQVGGLLPGTHQVAVVIDSFPASFALQGTAQRTVQVLQGQLTTVDFSALPLGSISGHVLYAPDGGFGNLQGAKNVYVVAEPGDYAAITNDDGSFLLDNIPPGSYQVNVDPETLPDDQSVVQGPDEPIQVFGGTDTGGLVFKLGAAPKAVVFSFDNGKKAGVSVNVKPDHAPPGAVVNVVVQTSEEHPTAVTQQSDAFGSFPLRFDAKLRSWIGKFIVPVLQAGDYALRIEVDGPHRGIGDASLTVDPKLPLIATRVLTHPAQAGHTIAVTAKILAPVEAGDTVRFEDGYTFKLPEPRGELYAFDVRLWSRGLPYHGTIENKAGKKFPLVLEAPHR